MHYFWAALQFLTRIPLPFSVAYNERVIRRSVVFFPFVGMVIGWLIAWFGYGIQFVFPDFASSVLLLAFWVGLSGALHLDGLLDSADGLLSHRSRESKLEIMKDSRVGAMAVVVCFIYLTLKLSLIVAFLQTYDLIFNYVWLALVPILSRWGMTFAIAFNPYAKHDGFGSLYARANRRHALGSSFAMFVGITFTLFLFGETAWQQKTFEILFVMILITLFFVIGFSYLCRRKLGGMTGDTYGATNEGLELLLMLFLIGWGV
jgi:adenosylcobinamide-GDP ribazoletransferase